MSGVAYAKSDHRPYRIYNGTLEDAQDFMRSYKSVRFAVVSDFDNTTANCWLFAYMDSNGSLETINPGDYVVFNSDLTQARAYSREEFLDTFNILVDDSDD